MTISPPPCIVCWLVGLWQTSLRVLQLYFASFFGYVLEEGFETSVSGVSSRRFYHFEGDEMTEARSLNHHGMELAGLRSYDILNKTDAILSSSEAEDMVAALRSIYEATSWMDWWTYGMKSLTLQSSTDTHLLAVLSWLATDASSLWLRVLPPFGPTWFLAM